jgi:hypothetical protein
MRPALLMVLACTLATVARAYEPAVNYMLQCMGCHTSDGSGEPGRVPSIRDTVLPFARLPAGRRYIVQVPGSAQSTLSDAELAALLNWMIVELGHGTPQAFAPFTAAEVAQYRRTPLTDVRSERERLLALTH